MMLAEDERRKIASALEELEDSIEIIVVPNENWKDFEDFAKVLDGLSDKISYRVEGRDGLIANPALILKKGDRENIVYHALPSKNELEPFLNTLVKLSRDEPDAPEGIEQYKAEIMIFVMPICPHCARVVETANAFAIANKAIRSIIVDASRFTDLAQKFDVTSAPTVIINREIKLVGYISKNDLFEWIKRASSDYKVEYMSTLLKEGRTDDVKEMIAKSLDDVKILADLLAYPDFMVRLGAMAILEQLHKENPKIIEPAKDRIRMLLKHEDFRIREDVAMLLGSIGDESDIKFLEELLSEESQEVRDSALEAIEEIKMRLGCRDKSFL
jgi:glutaredoxin